MTHRLLPVSLFVVAAGIASAGSARAEETGSLVERPETA
jgi:hypothetical protein